MQIYKKNGEMIFGIKVSVETDAVDVAEAGGYCVVVVGADGEGHGAGVVELLGEDFEVGLLDKAHHVVHRQVGECEFYLFHYLSLHYLSFFERKARGFAVGGDEAGGAEFYASEVAYYDDDRIGQSE